MSQNLFLCSVIDTHSFVHSFFCCCCLFLLVFLTKYAYVKMDLQHADWWDVCEIMNRKSERGEEESAVGVYTDIYLGKLRKTTIT